MKDFQGKEAFTPPKKIFSSLKQYFGSVTLTNRSSSGRPPKLPDLHPDRNPDPEHCFEAWNFFTLWVTVPCLNPDPDSQSDLYPDTKLNLDPKHWLQQTLKVLRYLHTNLVDYDCWQGILGMKALAVDDESVSSMFFIWKCFGRKRSVWSN